MELTHWPSHLSSPYFVSRKPQWDQSSNISSFSKALKFLHCEKYLDLHKLCHNSLTYKILCKFFFLRQRHEATKLMWKGVSCFAQKKFLSPSIEYRVQRNHSEFLLKIFLIIFSWILMQEGTLRLHQKEVYV